MQKIQRLLVLASLIILIRSACLDCKAQAFGSISGTITDSSGAIVVGAKVTILNATTGNTRSVSSNSAGRYSFPTLPPGSFRLTVESTGFETDVYENLSINALVP